ncbi:MAG: tryptophan-rich sensory protein [Solirubrobacterales bacterium]
MKILVTITFFIMIASNLLGGILPINGVSTSRVSELYPNLFTPSGVTFSIWGVIYLLLGLYTIYQLRNTNSSNKNFLDEVGICFSISSVANAAWIISWHYNLISVSMILMLVILACLILIAQILNKKNLSKKERLFIKLPFGVYFGWITVAAIANAIVLIVSIGFENVAMGVWFTVAVLFAGAVIGIGVMFKYSNIAYGVVLIWAYSGILLRHVSASGFQGRYTEVIVATIMCIGLFVFDEIYIFNKIKTL